MWGSLLGAVTAFILTLSQRIMSLEEVVNAWYQGMRAMIYAMIILVLAWALSGVTEELETANFLVSVLGDTLPVQLLPVIVFFVIIQGRMAKGLVGGAVKG